MAALGASGIRVLDVRGPGHNRSVTLVGDEEALRSGILGLFEVASRESTSAPPGDTRG
jgi:hypothetical protein